MCKIRELCKLPKGFLWGCNLLLIIARARGVRGGLSGRAQCMETKGFPAIGATQHALAFVYKRSFISGM